MHQNIYIKNIKRLAYAYIMAYAIAAITCLHGLEGNVGNIWYYGVTHCIGLYVFMCEFMCMIYYRWGIVCMCVCVYMCMCSIILV